MTAPSKNSQKTKGSKPKVICLFSSGIDSPVAAHLLLEQGIEVIPVFCYNYPYMDEEEIQNVKLLLHTLSKLHKVKLTAYMIKHGPSLMEFSEHCEPKAMCILCKRMMLRTAEKIAKKEKAIAIMTGENLGQVASQTLDNLIVNHAAVKLPVLTPLLGFDKEEIVQIAKKIKTYNHSIAPTSGCSAVPRYPLTHARIEQIQEEERNVNVKKLVDASFKSIKAVKY
ncbi:MAG: 7-cyano-7-deazaguanine synthase [archaeon]